MNEKVFFSFFRNNFCFYFKISRLGTIFSIQFLENSILRHFIPILSMYPQKLKELKNFFPFLEFQNIFKKIINSINTSIVR